MEVRMMPELLTAVESPLTEPRLESVEDHIIQVIRLRTGGMIRNLRVDVGADRVRLTGRTTSFYNKQLATHAAMSAACEHPLSNEIVVT